MAIYTPSLLKFFDCSVGTTVMDACPDLYHALIYRNKKETELNSKPNNYFYNGDYQTALEAEEEEESDDEIPFYHAFSQEFDDSIRGILQIYQAYSSLASSDEMLQ